MSAFGITINDRKSAVAEKPPMSKKKKQLILGGSMLAAAVLVLAWQYWPTSLPEDPAVVANPQIKQVIQAEQQKNVPALQQMVVNKDPIVASRAVTALAGLGRADVIESASKDSRMEVRAAAVSAMAANPQPAQLRTLASYMKSDPSPEVRLSALTGLSKIQDAQIFEPMLDMLNDPSPTLRRAAVRELEVKLGLKFSRFDADIPDPAMIAKIRSTVNQFRANYQPGGNQPRKGG